LPSPFGEFGQIDVVEGFYQGQSVVGSRSMGKDKLTNALNSRRRQRAFIAR
jgi:hypothetical protein